jgi:hypothetical protein
LERLISPALAELPALRQPLTAGETMVLDMFCRTLDPEWEIYIQPHLNGLRPDFVLLHPRVGIAVFEVKDWNLDALDYFVRKGTKRPELWARRDGKEFSRQSDNPFPKVEYYREAIYNLYCPRLVKDKGFGAITAGVIFPFANTDRLHSLFAPFLKHGEQEAVAKYTPLSGADEIANGTIAQVFPESVRKSSMLMRPELADDLRGWLMEPDFSATQRRPLEMNAAQQQFAGSRTESGFRRIKGPAGSGKSLVLAARAARLADEGKSVLVATFNITLWHYLRDLVVRDLRSASSYRNVVFVNFHSWCRDICETVGWSEAYDELWKSGDPGSVMETSLPELVGKAAADPAAPSYDAILVDEGQDYRPLWWATLRTFLKSGGEMLMAADATQDIYGTAGAWTDDVMTGAGFRGAWAKLDVSYRLPPSAVPIIRSFAERFLPDTEIDLPLPQQAALDLVPCRLRWVQCAAEQAVAACVDELLRMMHFTGEGSFANADITFLAADTASGSEVVDRLEARGIRSVSTFARDTQERRRQKVGFYMGDARIKATTLHSFKGWESPLLVIQAGASTDAGGRSLIYTGLTRLKHTNAGSRLTIVNSSPDFLDFGRTWPNFHDVSGESILLDSGC